MTIENLVKYEACQIIETGIEDKDLCDDITKNYNEILKILIAYSDYLVKEYRKEINLEDIPKGILEDDATKHFECKSTGQLIDIICLQETSYSMYDDCEYEEGIKDKNTFGEYII